MAVGVLGCWSARQDFCVTKIRNANDEALTGYEGGVAGFAAVCFDFSIGYDGCNCPEASSYNACGARVVCVSRDWHYESHQ